MINPTEVSLTVFLRGEQVRPGLYETSVSKTENGEVTELKVIDTPSFSKVTKHVSLGSMFVENALQEPPKGMKMKIHQWRGMPEEERIKLHVHKYADDLYPERKFYSYRLL